MPKIKVHEKALAHLSRGLYRSPASALRELVSNGWDANATEVTVDCNYPHFFQISVQDNGDGFVKEDFARIMSGGIGNSEKRSEPHTLKYGRAIIGRLGIGMLGIAQICGSFTVISRPRKGEGFRARVHLYDLLKEKLDVDSSDIVKATEIDVGEYKFETFEADTVQYGTTILADDVHPTFTRSFQQSVKYEGFEEPHLDWSENLAIIAKYHSLQELGDYWRLLWELAASTPVPYIDETAIPRAAIKEEQARLLSAKFKLAVDGISLNKPIYLKHNPAGYTVVKVGPFKSQVYGNELAFEGYVAVQEGSQLRPDELRGIMIRIKGIGIGYYDPSLLDYRYNQGPRSRWVTGEIFVSKGLENALNVDRDSFNRFHPEFRVLQEHVHSLLRNEVFPKVYKNIEVRSKARAETRALSRTEALQETIADITEKNVRIGESEQNDSAAELDVTAISKGKEIRVFQPPIDLVPTKKSNRQLAAAILSIYEVACLQQEKDSQREMFTTLLMKLLKRW